MGRLLAGLDVGGTKCAAVIGMAEETERAVTVLDRREKATKSFSSPEETLFHLLSSLKEMLSERGASFSDVKKVGISCGGPLDTEKGLILSPPNLPGWDNVKAVDAVKEFTHTDAVLENDANAGALAEHLFGAGRGSKNMIFLTFGTGIGAGLILDGHLIRGANGMAGECGHVRLEKDGPAGYGKNGSFEGFCSGGGIARLGQKIFKNAPPETAKEIIMLARDGNEEALATVKESAKRLGQGLAVLVDVLNPDTIVLGGIFSRAEDLFRKDMEKELAKEALPSSLAVCRIVPASLGEKIGDVACLTLSLR